MKRRDFLKLLGITTGVGVLSSCGVEKGTEKLIPILIPPDDNYIPGQPIYYTSSCTECPANCGMSVKTRELHPIKLEGLSGHPVNSQGALCLRGQSSLMRLYHPRRIRQPLLRQANNDFQSVTWSEAFRKINESLKKAAGQNKKNVYFAGRTTGSLAILLDAFSVKTKVERLPEYEPLSHANLRKANAVVFGVNDIPNFHISGSDFLLTVGADILDTFVSPVEYAGQVKKARENSRFSWTHIAPVPSLTGIQADQTLKTRPGSETAVLAFLLQELSKQPAFARRIPLSLRNALPAISVKEAATASNLTVESLHKLVTRFVQARRPLIIAGGVSTEQPGGLEVAVLAALIQKASGMTNELVDFADTENYGAVGNLNDVQALIEQLENGEIGTLFISRANPVATLPGNLNFAAALKKAQLRIGMGDFLDETLKQCDVVLPLSHSLESWGDAQPRQSVVNVIQPTVEPIFDSRSEGDILLSLMGETAGQTYQKWLFNRWKEEFGDSGVDEFLKTGYRSIAVSRPRLKLNPKAVEKIVKNVPVKVTAGTALYLMPSVRMFDGRTKALDLVQTIPDPLTSISYGEWLSVGTKTAKKFGLKDGDQVKISAGGEDRWLPVRIQAGLQPDVFSVHLGMIEALPAAVDKRSGAATMRLDDITIAKTGARIALPILAGSTSQQGRGLIPVATESGHKKAEKAEEIREHSEQPETFYPEHKHKNYRWSMAIDLESCTGCSACVAACYVENNIPIANRDQHLMGREMSWIRLEPYVESDETVNFLVMLCQQCENAPCESVCPVFATYHNPEGLNVQVYNRCVGTRYCSNNCPYKVRRFNWFDHPREEPLNLMVNPDVFVRSKGIMEKCTFCIQRIRFAEDIAKDENRKVRDGEVTPACEQTCPTQAIVFGNMLDENSRVHKMSRSERTYRVFAELGVEPAVYYLGKEEKHNEA